MQPRSILFHSRSAHRPSNKAVNLILRTVFPLLLIGLSLPLAACDWGWGGFGDNEDPPQAIRTYLVYFGSSKSATEIDEISRYVVGAFSDATTGIIDMEIADSCILSFPPEDRSHDYSTVHDKLPLIEAQDLPRLWYYYHRHRLFVDVKAHLDNIGFEQDNYDMIFVLSEAQFEGTGFYLPSTLDKPSIWVEAISLGNWSNGVSYSKNIHSQAFIVDETIHETGHFMGLAHSCAYCYEGIIDAECCELCENKNDVMSYCRQRSTPESQEFYSVYAPCNLAYIEHEFFPSFMMNREGATTYQNVCD